MLTLLSPAKNLNEAPITLSVPTTSPAFQKDAAKLARIAKTKTAQDLKDLMHISDNLAELNVDRFQSFVLSGQSNSAKPAMLTFNGDVYGGLNADTLDDEGLEFAQAHVRILSGLYGLLRPLDVMQPYRLEMGIKFENEAGKDLYAFWKDTIAPALNEQSEAQNSDSLINLASNEYFKSVDKKALKPAVISPRFLEEKDGKARVLSFYAKRARGLMARYIIDNRIDRPDGIYDFNIEGYTFDKTASKPGEPVFSRPQPAPKNAK